MGDTEALSCNRNLVGLSKMNVTIKTTSKKYEKMLDELVPPLFELLKELDALEREIFERDCAMNREKSALKIPFNQLHPKWMELVSEYRARFKDLIDGRVSENLMARGYANRFGEPSEYFYVSNREFSLEITMQKDDMLSAVTHYKRSSLDMKHKFVLRLIDGRWMLDEKYYGYEDENTWYLDGI